MHDRQIHFTFMGGLATACGVIAVALAVGCYVFDDNKLGLLSIHFAVGSALFRVRSWLCILAGRERAAFDMGRESAKMHSVR